MYKLRRLSEECREILKIIFSKEGLIFFGITWFLLSLVYLCSTGCNSQTVKSQQNVENKLAQSQAEPFDGGSTRKAYKRILK